MKGKHMVIKKLIWSGVKKHRSTLAGILILSFFTILTLGSLLTIRINSKRYVSKEQSRIGYGDISLWVSNVPNDYDIRAEVEELSEVERVTAQNIIYANYEVNEIESDSEGQLIMYEEDRGYHFFDDELQTYVSAPNQIKDGEIYVPASLISMMNVKIGDELSAAVTRNSGRVSFTVKGFYEDSVMGSSMIGMKGLLISENDYWRLSEMIQNAGIDNLARTGQILHITAEGDMAKNTSQLLHAILEHTGVSPYLEFSHSKSVMEGFMLVLQNVFSGFLLAFVIVLLVVVFILLSHSIRA